MAAGDFTIGDTTTTAATELTTLFGVAQGVGDTPVYLKKGTTKTVPGGFSAGFGPGSPGARQATTTTETVPGPSLSVTEALQGFYQMPSGSAALQNLQQQLYAGGFYPASYYSKTSPKVPQFGATDDDSFAAFKSAVVQAARSGKPLYDDVLPNAIASVAAGGGPGAKTRVVPPTVQPPNPADIRAVVTASAKTLLGHGVSEDVIGRIISGFTTEVTRSQAGVQNDQLTGGSVMQAPDVSSYVDQALRKANPTDVGMHSALQGADLVLQAFQSSLGNAPTGGS